MLSSILEHAKIRSFPVILLALPLCLAGCQSTPSPGAPRSTQAAIRTVLEEQQRDWNQGKIDHFMLGYAKADTTRFASGNRVILGWQRVLERYQAAYGNRAAMGTLDFSEIDITPLGRDHALAFGRWHLKRDIGDLDGLFSLIFLKTSQGWRVVHDHTSKADAP